MNETCVFCGRDPFHYVYVGVGFVPVAIDCCGRGVALYQHGDAKMIALAERVERMRARAAEVEERMEKADG